MIRRTVLLVLLAALPVLGQDDLRIIPQPRTVERKEGIFPLRGVVTIAVASGSAEDRFAAGLLQQEIESATPAQTRLVSGAEGQIVLALSGAPPEVGEEGYRIDAASDGVRVSANTAAGLFYGVQTMRQMVHPDGIPAATVTDWPAMRWRGLHDDLSRGPIPTLDYIKRQIRTVAEYKINLYSFYIEHTFAYKKHPLIAPPGGALTEAEVRELVAYARRYHVEIVPEQQTFGHLHHVLKYEKYNELAEISHGHVLTPTNPKTYEFIKSLYEEIVPLYPGPFLHIGADETDELGQGQTKKMVEEIGVGRAYFNHIRKVYDLLAPYKKKLMFWGDIAMNHPELLPELPHDLIVMSWEYDPRENFDRQLKPFRDARLDVFVCPGVNNWNRVFPDLDNAIPNIRVFTREGQKYGALGQFNTTWDDDGDALFSMVWYPVLYGAAAAWQEGDADPERFRRAFDWAFFRNTGEEFSQAILKINTAHTLMRKAGGSDASNSLTWLNPFLPPHRARLAQFAPVASELRVNQEEAIELIERNRANALRNADLLDYLVFAARRLDFFGLKVLYAQQIRDLYQEALANQKDPQFVVRTLQRISSMNGLLQDGRDFASLLRAECQRLWLAENRPYWLGNVLAYYDREVKLWLDKVDDFRQAGIRYRQERKLPSAEELGLGQ